MSIKVSKPRLSVVEEHDDRHRVDFETAEPSSASSKRAIPSPSLKQVQGRRKFWTQDEDNKLKSLVQHQGAHKWKKIASYFTNRTAKQCRDRWKNQLHPSIRHIPWAKEEDERLEELHRIHGNKWSVLAKMLQGRTDNAVKNHWHALHRVKQVEPKSIRKRTYHSAMADSNILTKDDIQACVDTMETSTISPMNRIDKRAKRVKASSSCAEVSRVLDKRKSLKAEPKPTCNLGKEDYYHPHEPINVLYGGGFQMALDESDVDDILDSSGALDDIFQEVIECNARLDRDQDVRESLY